MCAGCAAKPLLTYSLDTPPVMLSTAATMNIIDGRGRFREIYCAIREDHGKTLPDDRPCDQVILRLNDEPAATGLPVHVSGARFNFRIIVIPGIFSECIANKVSTLSDALSHLQTQGYKTAIIQVAGRSSSTSNAKQIRDALVAMDNKPGEKVILVGYSKGTPDILEALVNYPDVLQMVSAVVSIAGVVNGTPLADSFAVYYDELLKTLNIKDCSPGDGGGVDSLRRSTRLAWLSTHQLPKTIKYYSVVGFDEPDGISAILRSGYDQLSQIDPRNDSQVIYYDAVIPQSTLLGYVKADHWAIAMPFSRTMPLVASTIINRNSFPREVLLEAVIRFIEEDIEGEK